MNASTGEITMSKPRHSERYRGHYVGYGIYLRELRHVKGTLAYNQNLHYEIRHLERIGDTRRLKKLRKYLARAI